MDGWVALEEWKLRLTSAKVESEVETELGKKVSAIEYLDEILFITTFY